MPSLSIKSNRPSQFSLMSLLAMMLAVGILFGLIGIAIRRAREQELWRANLKEIGLAMHNYHDVYGCFPPAFIPDDDGKPMHSWRVLLLQMMDPGTQRLFDQYDFEQHWDSSKNLAIPSVSVPRQLRAADGPSWAGNVDDASAAQARSAGKDLLVFLNGHGLASADNSQFHESVDSDKSTDATPFRLSTAAIEQSCRLAAAELSKPGKLRDRRPAGLEDLESPPSVRRAVEQAIKDLAKLSQSERKWTSDPRTRLRYLGDQAFDMLVDGIRGDNRDVAVQSCALLSTHGERAVPLLISVLGTHTEERVRAAAARALGQSYHPDAFRPLIDALDDESQSVRIDACYALGYFRDARAIAPLSKRVGDPNGHIARNSIRWIRQPLSEGPAFWPPQLLKIRKLTVDAKTLKGEQFGQPEIDVLTDHLQSKYWDVSVQCLHALAALNARQSIPQIIASRHCDSRAHVLAQMPTPASMDALVKDLGSVDKHVKRQTVFGVAGAGGRWAAPLLIAMLDDASLERTAHEEEMGLVEGSVTWPESHLAHTALCRYFWEHGLPGESRNLYRGETNDVAAEIVSLRKWWAQHGEDFLAGRHVPNPRLTTIVYFDP